LSPEQAAAALAELSASIPRRRQAPATP
jgi:hypothetical protein